MLCWDEGWLHSRKEFGGGNALHSRCSLVDLGRTGSVVEWLGW